MLTNFHAQSKNDRGFTLIELLVVILIIGILAAIAIPSFLNQRVKGQDACAISMANQMVTAVKSAATDNQGSFSGITADSLSIIENSISGGQCGSGTVVTVGAAVTSGACLTSNPPTSSTFCVGAQSASGNFFAISENGGAVKHTCTVPTGFSTPLGGCKGSGGTSGTW